MTDSSDPSESNERDFRAQFQKRRECLHRGEAIVLADDEALGNFFDEIDAEVDRELADEQKATS